MPASPEKEQIYPLIPPNPLNMSTVISTEIREVPKSWTGSVHDYLAKNNLGCDKATVSSSCCCVQPSKLTLND
jgi:hypothetical protein